MQAISVNEMKNTVVFRAELQNGKSVDKFELKTRDPETIKKVERRLMDRGIQRMDRHSSDGIQLRRPPSKSGRGGKYTWEGADRMKDYEMQPDPPAMDKGDPNYEDEYTKKNKIGDDVSLILA